MRELTLFTNTPLAMELGAANAFVADLLANDAAQVPVLPIRLVGSSDVVVEADDLEKSLASGGLSSGVTAVVPLFGPLSMHGGWFSTSTASFARTLKQLDASENVGTIVVQINSPGGTVTGTEEAANALREIRDRGQTRTISVVEPMMASAATWIGTAAHEVVSTPSGESGSIGVISVYQDISKMAEAAGVTFSIERIPANKARFSGVEPLTDEMRETMVERNTETYGQFVSAMAKNRGVSRAQVQSDFGQGEMMSANEAREAGLIDRIATLEQVLDGIGKPGRPRGSRRRANENRLRVEDA